MSRLSTLAVALLLLVNCHCHTEPRNEEVDISNEIVFREFLRIPKGGRSAEDDNLESNAIPEIQYLIPSEVKDEISTRLRSNGFDPYFLRNLELDVPPKTLDSDRPVKVTLDRGVIVGMSDFRSVDHTKKTNQGYHLLLVWNRLRVHYRVTVDRGGLRNAGEVELIVGRLLMDVQPGSQFPVVEMSNVTDIRTELSGLESLLDDFERAVCLAAERKIKGVVNREVRNILLKYTYQVLGSISRENMVSSYYASERI